MDIYISGTKSHLLAQLEAAHENIKVQPDGMVSYTIHAESDRIGGGEVNIFFSDEDMDRPEAADKIVVGVGQ